MKKSKEKLKKELTEEQYYITQEKGTERPFTGEYNDHKEDGIYTCICCAAKLFDSKTKYNSGSGWPSFYQPNSKEVIKDLQDHSHGMNRTEVVCGECGAHLGHVFNDGPRPTGLRYCINSASLRFEKRGSFS